MRPRCRALTKPQSMLGYREYLMYVSINNTCFHKWFKTTTILHEFSTFSKLHNFFILFETQKNLNQHIASAVTAYDFKNESTLSIWIDIFNKKPKFRFIFYFCCSPLYEINLNLMINLSHISLDNWDKHFFVQKFVYIRY